MSVPAIADGDPFNRIHTRLVDRAHQDTEVARLPAWSFGRDRRLVLRAPPARDWVVVGDLDVIDPTKRRTLRLPERLRGIGDLAVRFAVVGESAGVFEAASVDRSGDGVTLSVQAPPVLAGMEAMVQVRSAVAEAIEAEPIRLAEIVIPEQSELRFAIGRTGEDPVRFSITSCRAGVCEPVYCEVAVVSEGWLDRRLDLAALAGGVIELRFDSRSVAGDALRNEPDLDCAAGAAPGPVQAEGSAPRVARSTGLFANPTIFVRSTRADAPPSLLLVSIDTLGARHLGTYGSRRDTSPFLDGFFSRRGLVIERFISSEVHTGPSHMSLFTGLPPTAHGVHAGRFGRLPYAVETLASRMRAAGHDTGAVTENAAIYVGGGFARGFDTYREVRRGRESSGIVQTFEAGRAWLDAHAETPFFLFLHTYETHWQFEPPPPYDALFEGDGLVDPSGLGEPYALTRYEQEIRFVDDQMEALFEHLEQAGFLENTVVVVTSDHGESFLEHGRLGHGDQLHGEVVHVPLLVAGPGVPVGERRSGPMAQIDLAPTLLELVGAPPLPDAMGASVLEWWRGEVEPPRRPAFSEAWFQSGQGLTPLGKVRRIRNERPIRGLTTGGHRLIEKRTPGPAPEYSLYALSGDPGELKDVARIAPVATAELQAELEAHLAAAIAKRDLLIAREEQGLTREARDVGPEVDGDRIEQLRALGYID